MLSQHSKTCLGMLQIHFISASCENMIDGKGMLPGDVLTASNGKTVEVRLQRLLLQILVQKRFIDM